MESPPEKWTHLLPFGDGAAAVGEIVPADDVLNSAAVISDEIRTRFLTVVGGMEGWAAINVGLARLLDSESVELTLWINVESARNLESESLELTPLSNAVSGGTEAARCSEVVPFDAIQLTLRIR